MIFLWRLMDFTSVQFFNTINCNILLYRLKVLAGIAGSALDWVSSYLSDRSFSVRVGKCTSNIASLNCGTPQGLVMG